MTSSQSSREVCVTRLNAICAIEMGGAIEVEWGVFAGKSARFKDVCGVKTLASGISGYFLQFTQKLDDFLTKLDEIREKLT